MIYKNKCPLCGKEAQADGPSGFDALAEMLVHDHCFDLHQRETKIVEAIKNNTWTLFKFKPAASTRRAIYDVLNLLLKKYADLLAEVIKVPARLHPSDAPLVAALDALMEAPQNVEPILSNFRLVVRKQLRRFPPVDAPAASLPYVD